MLLGGLLKQAGGLAKKVGGGLTKVQGRVDDARQKMGVDRKSTERVDVGPGRNGKSSYGYARKASSR